MTRASLAALGAVALLVLGAPPAASGAAGDGQAVFDQYCQACHSIGGGDGAGPDLEGLADRREADWVKAFILAPDEVIASGDPIAKELVDAWGTQMPNLGLTDTQAEALLAYLGFAAAPPTTPTETETTPPATTPVETMPTPAGDAARGKDLFTGAGRFSEGGPSCLSCHSVAGVGALGGGQLGPDLTGSYEKYGGEKGLTAVLATVPFPTMAPIFTRRPLTEAEQADLVAFLKDAPNQERPGGAARNLLLLSFVAVVLIAGAGLVIWRRRLDGVRKPLVDRSRGK